MRSLYFVSFVFVSLIFNSFGCGMESMGSHHEPNHWYPSSDVSSGASDAWSAEASSDAGVEEPPNEKDKFEHVGTNPYVLVASDPLSTFAVDVDTASYDIFVRDINQGYLPVADSVRLEEYVNYFPYDYEAPTWDDDAPFKVTLDASINPFVEGTQLLSVGIKGKVVPEEAQRDSNIVFLIDVSGSMGWDSNKLPLVKKTLGMTLDILYPTDTVSIVTYAGNIAVKLAPTTVAEKATILQAIDELGAGGGTKGADGLLLAYAQASAGFIEGGLNHIILCTDGDFNIGPSSDKEMLALITEKRKTGVTMTVLGFGVGNLNDSMMEKISNAGNGVYGFISSIEQATDFVMNRMLSTMLLIAKDMKIQVEFNPAKVHAFRLLGYENRAIADVDFRNDVIDAGEIGSGHTVTALYELVLAGKELPVVEGAPEPEDGDAYDGKLEVSEDELVRVKVRWKELDEGEEDAASEVQQGLTEDQVALTPEETSGEMQWAVAIAAFAEILKDSPYGTIDNIELIQALVDANVGEDSNRLEFQDLLSKAIPLLLGN
jgi:Ca-activated chloride channel family protein